VNSCVKKCWDEWKAWAKANDYALGRICLTAHVERLVPYFKAGMTNDACGARGYLCIACLSFPRTRGDFVTHAGTGGNFS
jgi:hypothetical protein